MKMKNMLLVGCAVVGLGCYTKMNINQTVDDKPLAEEKISLDNIIQEIKDVGQLVLTQETGTATIEYNSSKGKMFSWLTNTKTVISLDYKVLLGIDLNDIEFIKGENEIIVITPDDFEIISIETDNKEIESTYSFLSKLEDHELLVELEEKIIEDIKHNGITEEVKLKCAESFENNLKKLGNNLDVDIRFY